MSSTRGKKDRDRERHGLGTERGPPHTLKNTMSSPAFCLCPGAGSPKVPRLLLNFCCSLTFHRAEITDSAVLTKINYFSIASVSPGFMKFEGKAASSFHITAISREAVIKFQCITSWLLWCLLYSTLQLQLLTKTYWYHERVGLVLEATLNLSFNSLHADQGGTGVGVFDSSFRKGKTLRSTLEKLEATMSTMELYLLNTTLCVQ